MRKSIATLAAVATASLVAASMIDVPAQGVTSARRTTVSVAGPDVPTAKEKATARRITKDLQRLALHGATDARIRKELGLVRISSAAMSKAQGKQTIRGTRLSPVKLYRPRAYPPVTDSWRKTFYVLATWKIRKDSGIPDRGKIGKLDAFGVSLSRKVRWLDRSLTVCPRYWHAERGEGTERWYPSGAKCRHPRASSANARHVAYRFQDTAVDSKSYDAGHQWVHRWWGWNNWSGVLAGSFRPMKRKCMQGYSQYAHTWSKTGITWTGFDVGIGAGGGGTSFNFGLSFGPTSSSHWRAIASDIGPRDSLFCH